MGNRRRSESANRHLNRPESEGIERLWHAAENGQWLPLERAYVLGPRAFHGGDQTAALGLALHILIVLSAAAVYLAASRKPLVLVRRPVVSGLMFGLCVWALMHPVVLPLSLVGGGMSSPVLLINQLLIHALGAGVPIALVASRSAHQRSKQR